MDSKHPLTHLRASDIRGIAQLAAQATEGVTGIVEGVHQSVWSTMGVPGGAEPGRTRGITGLVYKTVRGVTKLAGKGVDTILARLEPVLTSGEPETPHRDAVFAALNGVMGDRLAADNHPFAIPMSFRYRGERLDLRTLPSLSEPSGKILLMIHGLCMTDHQWRTESDDRVVDHGESLASALGYTPVYLRYNTGLHISKNGRELSARLEELVTHWPTAIEEVTVVAHSMGGLLIRSATQLAREEGLRWPNLLRKIVFLGTPNHGAPLERAGSWVDQILAATPYTTPFTRLGQVRSAGITDLRFGLLMDEDWRGRDRFSRANDDRRPVPLPDDVSCFAVAALISKEFNQHTDRLIGDGLVPLDSALGVHSDSDRRLVFDESSRLIVFCTNHLGLLSNPDLTRQMERWLTPN